MKWNFIFLFLAILIKTQSTKAIVFGQSPTTPFAEGIVQIQISFVDEKGEAFESYCSGAFISDSTLLTAGHCVREPNARLVRVLALPGLTENVTTTQALSIDTSFNPEEIEKLNFTIANKNQIVPGCSPEIKPLVKTDSLDLALVHFAAKTTKKWYKIDKDFVPRLNTSVDFFGFGSLQPNLAGEVLRGHELRTGQAVIWRWNEQRFAIRAMGVQPYAVNGDSGGPVFFNGKIVGVLNTMEESCETELGEDYGIVNSITYLSGANVQGL